MFFWFVEEIDPILPLTHGFFHYDNVDIDGTLGWINLNLLESLVGEIREIF